VQTTTVRFAPADWKQLAEVCARDGVAKAQYIREATVAQLAISRERELLARRARERAALRQRVELIERELLRRLRARR
jgi:hypothetical protein